MNMNTYSSRSIPLKAMMAYLHTLILLILMKVVRNSITRPISEIQFLTFQAVLHKNFLKWSNRKAESKKMHSWRITVAGVGSESIFRDQQPTGTAPNCDAKQDYLWTRKLVMGKCLQKRASVWISTYALGCKYTEMESKQSHHWKLFSRQPLG